VHRIIDNGYDGLADKEPEIIGRRPKMKEGLGKINERLPKIIKLSQNGGYHHPTLPANEMSKAISRLVRRRLLRQKLVLSQARRNASQKRVHTRPCFYLTS